VEREAGFTPAVTQTSRTRRLQMALVEGGVS